MPSSAKVKIGLILSFLLALSLAWQWTPVGHWLNLETIVSFQQTLQSYPGTFFWVIGGYLLSNVALFPVTVLNIATVFTFGPVWGNAYALAGWLLSAAAGYGAGRAMGRNLLQRMAGPRLNGLLRQAGRRGFLTVLTMRVLPVAPFTLVNLFVGASGIRFRDFFSASLVGRIPGTIVLGLAALQLQSVLQAPEMINLALLAGVVLLVPLAIGWSLRRLAPLNASGIRLACGAKLDSPRRGPN